MADDKSDPLGQRPVGDTTDPRKPKATLDLKATVIETRDMPKSGADAAARFASKSPESKTDEKAETIAAAAATKPEDAGDNRFSSPEAAASAATAEPADTPPSPRGSRSFVSHLLAGAVGALLTFFVANALADRIGLGGANVEALTNRIATLEAELKELAADTSESTLRDKIARVEFDVVAAGGWKDKVAALEADQRKAADAVKAAEAKLAEIAAQPAGDASIDPAVSKRLDTMEEQLRTIAEASKTGEGGNIAGLAALTGRISDFESELQSRVDGVKKAFEERLVSEVAALDSRLAEGLTAGSGATVQIATLKEGNLRLGRDIEGLKLTSERLEQSIGGVRGSTEEIRTEIQKLTDADGATTKRIDSLSADLTSALGQRVTVDDLAKSLEPLSAKLAAVEADIGTLKTNESSRNEAASRILLSLELTNLRRAIERGGSFAKEMAAVRAIAPKDLDLAPLAQHAEAGLPSVASLEGGFVAAANAALDAERTGDPEASVIDQLWSGAQSIVRIRKTGEVAGNTTEAVVARMEQRLAQSDLEGVSREAADLGEKPKAAMAFWLGQVEARLTVDRSLASIEDELKKLIGGATASSTN
jgi:hypothetical protein